MRKSARKGRGLRLPRLLGLLLACAALASPAAAGAFAAGRPRRAIASQCDVLQRFLSDKNSTEAVLPLTQHIEPDERNTICGGHCCNIEMEESLRQQAKEDFHKQIHHHSRSLLGLLATTADALRETVTVLARQSENKTLTLFNQVYRAMAIQSKPSITSLYQAMVDYVSTENTSESLQQPLTQSMLHERFAKFFSLLFPIAYHHAVNPVETSSDFTEAFKSCLYKTMEEIEPFGDIPKQIALSLSKSLEATRVLIQALTLGKSTLEKTDGLLFSGSSDQQEACYKALLRMTHCPKCTGVPQEVMPCRGFCTNVMRGCLTEPASELDFAWSEYVETVERLVVAVDGHIDPLALNVEKAVRHLDSRISDAVMYAMAKGPALEEKVRKVCGFPQLESTSGPQLVLPANLTAPSRLGGSAGHLALDGRPLSSPIHLPPQSSANKLPNQLHAQLGNFLASVVRSRTFYGTLADTICEEYPDKSCWNGDRVGEYAKTVVDSSLISQRYNPELTFVKTGPNAESKGYPNANTSVLIDQLRHITQVVQSQLTSAPDSSALLADEALEGSGSGDRPLWGRRPGPDDTDDEEDADDDRDDGEASGSGMGPSVIENILPQNESESRGGATRSSLSALCLLLLAALKLGLP